MTEAQYRLGHYLKGRCGSFYTFLFQAIFAADPVNTAKLARAFPEEVECVRSYKAGETKKEG